MNCFVLLLGTISAELASRKISFTYVTDRKVKDIGEKLYRPPISKYQRYRYTHMH